MQFQKLQKICSFALFDLEKQLLCAKRYTTVPSFKMGSVKTLRDLGYGFNSEGKLRKLNESGEITDESFHFNISDKHQDCQAHYEDIGEAVTQHVYKLLELKENLMKLPVPKDSTNGTCIFVSKDYDKKDVLLILIHGSGVVRAGQWARSLIINESLDTGTQIPYIKKAIARNYGVIILNTNDNLTADEQGIKDSDSPEKHAIYVWKNYVSQTKASSILIVAHSYGGVVTVSLADKLKDVFEKRVKGIAFTDSAHGFASKRVPEILKWVAKNWVSSEQPLDTPIKTPDHDIARFSAGHRKHEMTSYSCMDSVFKFFEEKLSK